MDTQDEAFERYLLPSLSSPSVTHISQGHSLSAWRIPLPKINSKPISNGHWKNPNPNPNSPYSLYPKQRWPVLPLSQTASCPNVPNSKESDWPVRSVFVEVATIVTHLEGRLRPHPPPTLKVVNLMTSTSLQLRDSIWPHHDRAGPSDSPSLSSQLVLSVDPPNLTLARMPAQTNHRCFGGAR